MRTVSPLSMPLLSMRMLLMPLLSSALLALPLLCLAPDAHAAPAASTPPASAASPAFGAAERAAVVGSLRQQLVARYVFPELAASVADATAAKLARGGYDSAATPQRLAEALTEDLVALGKDKHFRVGFDPDFRAPPAGAATAPSSEEMAQMRQEMARMAYGLTRVQRLPGNVGYLEVRGFGPTPLVAQAYTNAMSLLAGTDALVLDLRHNGGGEPSSVAHLLSHFFAEGDERHLNDIYTRPENSTRQFWTNPTVGVHYTRPIYVLTSSETFSGGEECAYDLQTQKRATLVGETTGGGANPGEDVGLGHGLVAFIPTGRAINPITGTNWEHVGVKPDIAVPAADAMKTAYAAILTDLAAKATDPDEREGLQRTLARAAKGDIDLPGFMPRR